MELQLSAENVGQSGEAFAAANAIHKTTDKSIIYHLMK